MCGVCGGERGRRGRVSVWSVWRRVSVCMCVELSLVVYLFPIEVDVPTERSSGAREGEHWQRDRNRNIDTNLRVC